MYQTIKMKSFLLSFAALASLASVQMTAAQDCMSLEQVVCGSADHKALCAAANVGRFDELLSGTNWTIFAPTDAALGDFMPMDMFYWNNSDALKNVALYHTVEGAAVYAKDVTCDATVTMGNGMDTRVVCEDDMIYLVGAQNTEDSWPQITATDLEMCNGVVHVIDQVLLPDPVMDDMDSSPTPDTEAPADNDCATIGDLACGVPEFETLCNLLEASGLAATELGNGAELTVFAPNNDAFAALSTETLESLNSDTEALQSVLLYHVVMDKALASTDLVCTGLVMMANGQDSRTVCQGDGSIYQKGHGNPRDAMPEIVEADLSVCNAVVHVVNRVLLP